jgi:hypothetical protein
MITETQQTILEHVRSLKEENAAEHGFSLEAIIESARQRQEASGRRIIRLSKGEQDAGHQELTDRETKVE